MQESLMRHLDKGITLVATCFTNGHGKIWQDNPVGGIGLGGWLGNRIPGAYPHNMFLEAGAEGGWIGFLLLFSAQVCAVVHFWKKPPKVELAFRFPVDSLFGQ